MNQDLIVRITADTAGATTNITAVEAQLAALEKAYTGSTAATTAHTAAHIAAAPAIIRTGEAATGAGAAMGILDKNMRVVTMGANAAGLEMTSLGVKISALAGVVESAEAAFGPLILILVAFETAMKAFSFVKDAETQAAAFQAQMETLGASIATQGGNFDVAQGQIKAWAASESLASGILQAQLIPALNDLVTAGHSVADSETMLAVAEEVAIAKHVEVRDVVRDLISAEMGRARGLELLDANTKKVVDSHGHLSDILKVLHKDFEKAIEDDQSADRANARLRVEIEGIQLAIGQKLLPAIADMNYAFIGGIHSIELFGQGVGDVFAGIGNSIAAAITELKALPDALAAGWDAISHGNFKGAAGAMGAAAMKDLAAGNAQLGAAASHFGAGFPKIFDSSDDVTVGRHIAGAAVKAHQARLDHGISLVDDPTIGTPKTKGAGSGAGGAMSFTPADYKTDKVDEYTVAQKNLEAALKRVDDGEAGLAERIKTATTAEAEHTAQAAHDAQVTIDLLAKKSLLTAAVDKEKTQRASLTQQLKDEQWEAHNATEAYNVYGDAMLAAGNDSIPTQNILAQLKAHMDEANKAAAAFATSLKTVSDNLRTNEGALGGVNAKLDEFKSKAEEAFGAASRSWEEYQKKIAVTLKEDLDTANITNAAKVVYYGDSLAKMEALDVAYRAQFTAADVAFRAAVASGDSTRIRATDAALQSIGALFDENVKSMEAADGKYTAAYKGQIADREAAYKTFITTVQGFETSFMDDILKNHKSLGDSLKSVFQKMVDDYATALEQMVVKSAMMKALNGPDGLIGKTLIDAGIVQAPGASTGNPQLDAAIAAHITAEKAQTTSLDLSTHAETAATTSITAAARALDTLTAAAQHAASAVGSSGGGSGLGSIFGGGDKSGIGGDVFGKGSDPFAALFGGTGGLDFTGTKDVNIAGIGGADVGTGGKALPTDISKVGGASVSGAMQGLMIAQLVNGMTGGNSTWSSVGGGIGGAFGGPIGAAIGAAIGGLFGPHETQAQQPDIFNPAWGQVDVNWNGAPGAQTFGNQQFTASSQYNVGQGGTPEYKLMENWANAGAATTDAQKALQAKIIGLEGGNPNADFGITREAQGIAYLADGQQISVTDLIAMEQAFQANVGGASGPIPTFSVARSYPDFTAGTLSATGTQAAAGTVVAPGTTVAAAPTPVIVNVAGSVVTPADLIDAIATGLAQRGIGLSASSPAPRFVVTSSF